MSYHSLSSSDFKSIEDYQDGLSGLYSRDEVIDFSLQFLKRAISCDFVGWNRINADRRAFLDARIFPSLGSVLGKIIEPISRTLDTYWIFHHYYSIPYNVFDTIQITDLVSHGKFLESPIFREAYIHFNARHQLHIQIPSEVNHARINYNISRECLEFSDREKQLLDLVGRRTYRRLYEIPRLISNEAIMSHFYDAFDSATEGLITLDTDFSVREISASAKQLMKVFFPDYAGGYTLPGEIRKWISLTDSINGIQDLGISIKKTTTFRRWGRILIAILLKKPNEKYGILALQEDPVTLEQYLKTTKNLTRRQRQLFHLIKDGISDPSEIAHRLGIAERTVEGHRINLQRIVGNL